MLAYNHEKFIDRAINGVLMQVTDFSFELVIGEDCSTDRTGDICEEYQRLYPDIIKLRRNPSNLGMNKNFVKTYNECRGEYIAFCEGDDYWTYNEKLQKQILFMDKLDLWLSFHNGRMVNDQGQLVQERILPTANWNINKLLQIFPFTATIVIRKIPLTIETQSLYEYTWSIDHMVMLLHANRGDIGMLESVWCDHVYHKSGATSTLPYGKWALNRINSLEIFNKLTSKRHNKHVKQAQKELCYHFAEIHARGVLQKVKFVAKALRYGMNINSIEALRIEIFRIKVSLFGR